MLNQLNGLIVQCSTSWWKFLLVLLVQGATLQGLQQITARFPDVAAGAVPFDMQNSLTTAQIFTQLEGYTDEAFSLYWIFQAIDFVFPIFAALLLAAVCAFCLRHISAAWYEKINSRNLFVVLLLPAVFDYLENINLLWVTLSWPDQVQPAATLAVAAKMGKLSAMTLVFAVTAVLLVSALIAWARRRLTGRAA